MNQLFLFFALALIGGSVCFFVFSGCREKRQKDYAAIHGVLPVKYASDKAGYRWDFERNITHRLVQQKEADFSQTSLLSLQVNEGRLIGLDFKNSHLHFFDTALRTEASFGRKGHRKEENKGILSFDYSKGHLFLYDFGSRAVKEYAFADSSLLDYQPIENPTGVYRVVHLAGKRYLYAKPLDEAQDMDFLVFDSASHNVLQRYSLTKLLALSEKQNFPGMAYDGNFVSATEGKYVVYYCSFSGLFFVFDRLSGRFHYSKKTIDQTPPPLAAYVPITPHHKSLEISPNILFFPSACQSEDQLFLLNAINPSHDYVADIYDLGSEGRYRGSFFIPIGREGEKPISLAVHQQSVYVLYDNRNLVKYAIHSF